VTDQLVADVRLRRVKRLRRVADVLKIILFGFHVNLIVKQIFKVALKTRGKVTQMSFLLLVFSFNIRFKLLNSFLLAFNCNVRVV
jgi:hypothetical protein